MTNLMFPGARNLRVVFSRLLTAAFRTGVVIAVFSQVGPVQTQIIDWSNTTGSPGPWYHVVGNWAGGAAPTSTQTARFNQAATYQVWWDDTTASTTPAVGFLQVNSGNVTFLNNGGVAQHLFTINGSGGAGAFSDFSISGIGTLATIRGLHFQSLGGGFLGGATLTLDGSHSAGAKLTVAGSTGFDVSGNLNVQSGGIFENTVGIIGFSSGSTGVATVTGSGSHWNNSVDLFVGRSGSGTLNVQAGGLVSVSNNFGDGVIGSNSGSTGVATVTGSGSQWNSGRDLLVGNGGSGTLNVEDGGLVSNTGGVIGREAGSTGVATVTGSGSQWNNSFWLTVGNSGNGTLNVQDGGLVSNTRGRIGRGPGAGVATVTGSGSQWNNSDSLSVGITGNAGNGTLNVQNGGLVSNTSGFIGLNSGSTGVATVTGSGSQWNNSSVLEVGRSGSGNLNVEDGGLVSNTSGFIGLNSGSTGVATVTGSGSQWNNAGGLYVGGSNSAAGGAGTLTVADGGLVSVGGTTKLWSAGSLILDTGGILDTQTLDLNEGSFDLLNGGVLHADFVLGDLFNESGILAPGNSPGITSVSGNYGQGSAATLEIELGGLTAGQFDQLLIGGNADWNGMLDVSLYGGFSLGANQQYQIATVSGIQTGIFTGLGEGDLVGNFGGRDLFITYNGFGGIGGIGLYTAVPEPGTAGLLCLGGILAMLRRRKAA